MAWLLGAGGNGSLLGELGSYTHRPPNAPLTTAPPKTLSSPWASPTEGCRTPVSLSLRLLEMRMPASDLTCRISQAATSSLQRLCTEGLPQGVAQILPCWN